MSRALRSVQTWLLLAALASPCLLNGEPTAQLISRGYVSDFANVLDSNSAKSIDELCYRLEHWTGAQINVVTVHSLDGAAVENYTVSLFNQWREDPYSDLGVLILFAAQEQRYSIVITPRLQPILSGKVGKYEQEAIPYLNHQQYGPAMTLITRRVAEAIAADAQVGMRAVYKGAYLD